MTKKKRIISGIVAIPVALLLMVWGGFPFAIFVFALAIGGQNEFYRMCKEKGYPSVRWWGFVITALLFLNAYLIVGSGEPVFIRDYTYPVITLLVIGTGFFLVFKMEMKNSVISFGVTATGVFYVSWLILHSVLLREMKPFGREFLILAVSATWASDTIAYLTGIKFGKRRLSVISPNKSRAGALGSVVGGAAAVFILKNLFGLYFMTASAALILGGMVGFISIMGDLTESLFKRNLKRKDSGSFLPGHGGVLDRMDSMLFTVPFVYYTCRWVIL